MNIKTIDMAHTAGKLRSEGKPYRVIGIALGVTTSRAGQLVEMDTNLKSNPQASLKLAARTQACLDRYGLDTKEKAAEALKQWLRPQGTDLNGKPVMNFGQKSYDEACEWAGVDVGMDQEAPGSVRGCDHNRKLIFELRELIVVLWNHRAGGIPEKDLFARTSRLLSSRQHVAIRPYDKNGMSSKV
jgi:hypothetical protein